MAAFFGPFLQEHLQEKFFEHYVHRICLPIHDFSLTAQTLKTFSWSHMEEDFNWVFKVVQNERFHFQEWPKIKIFPHDIILLQVKRWLRERKT